VLKTAGHEVRLEDPETEGLPTAGLAARLAAFSPELAGISCATPSFPEAARIATLIRKVAPSCVTVAGGVHVSALPAATLAQAPDLDVAVIGEGEETMRDLARVVAGGKMPGPDALAGLPGIAYRGRDGSVTINAPRALIRDLDSLPFPARDLVSLARYVPHAHNRRGRRATTAISSRGCPYGCVFCASHVALGRGFRAHSPRYVVAELEHLAANFGVDQVIFNDDAFTLDTGRVAAICDLIGRAGLRMAWSCFARADSVTPELLRSMKRAGCFSVGFGVESGDPGILKRTGKNVSLDQIRLAVSRTREAGLKTQCFFVFGSPGETKETIESTVAFAIELKPVLAFFNMMVPYPGTEEYAARFGREDRVPDGVHWEDWVAIGPRAAISIPGVPKLERSVAEANRRFYFRPAQIMAMFRMADGWREIVQMVRGMLALLAQMIVWRLARLRKSGVQDR
jgi:radical SAM superfamily enzyme YgiQ (UPF0313 family)